MSVRTRAQALEILNKGDSIEAIMQKADGTKIYTFADAVDLVTADELTAKMMGGKEPDMGQRELSIGRGTYARTQKKYTAVDPSVYFNNRYKRVEVEDGKTKYTVFQVVTDFRALQTQSSGKAYRDQITTYDIKAARAANGQIKLELLGTKLVHSDDFCRNFIQKLDEDAMRRILPLIDSVATQVVNSDKLSV